MFVSKKNTYVEDAEVESHFENKNNRRNNVSHIILLNDFTIFFTSKK